MFDLNLIPLTALAGVNQAFLPGLFATASPRRPARGRAGDLLAMLITPLNDNPSSGGTPPSSVRLEELVNLLAKTYYQIPGTVTTALRSVVEVLNQNLLDFNLQHPVGGQQSRAFLNLLSIHANQLYLAHCGPTHTFVISTRNIDHFNDQQLAGRGLGLSRAASVRFYQSALDPGSTIIFCTDPPPIWNTSLLLSTTSLPIESLKRRLTEQVHPGFSAVLLQCQEGNGKVTFDGKTTQFSAPSDTSSGPSLRPSESANPGGISNKPQTPSTIIRENKLQSAGAIKPEVKPQQITSSTSTMRPGSTPPLTSSSSSVSTPVIPPIIGTPSKDEHVAAQKPYSTRRHTLSEMTRGSKPIPTTIKDEPVIQEMKRSPRKIIPWEKIAPFWKWFRSAEHRLGQWTEFSFSPLAAGILR